MIQEVRGDILLSTADAIAHGVAPNDDFKQGLALSLRTEWPAMYKDFRHYCRTTTPSTGELWSWKGAGGPAIINLFTQEPPERDGDHAGKASLTYVAHCLKELKKEAVSRGFKKIAISKLATGVGGLDWDKVKPLIESTLGDGTVKVFVYSTYAKGVAATEA